jgi:hypothetical protein
MGIPIWKRGFPHPRMEMGNASLFPYRDTHIETGIDASQYGNGECPFPYGESRETIPHFHTDIPIWKWGLLHHHMEMGNPCFHMGNQKYGSPFSYGDPNIETGIATSPYGNGECLFPYGESLLRTPCFHTGIPIWKRGLTHHHMEMGKACFHMGNHKKWLPVSIQGSPYGNGDQHFAIWKWGMPISIWGIIRNGSPFP